VSEYSGRYLPNPQFYYSLAEKSGSFAVGDGLMTLKIFEL
jgi:hypothetical protein